MFEPILKLYENLIIFTGEDINIGEIKIPPIASQIYDLSTMGTKKTKLLFFY